MNGLGARIRQSRKSQKLTLRDVAHMAGLTVSLLSQIENGKTNPSVATLIEVSRVLNVPVGTFFDSDERPVSPVTRESDRQVSHTANGINYYLLTPDVKNSPTEVLYCEYGPNSSIGKFHTHVGVECGFVLKGKLEVCIEEETYVLNDGDSIVFQSTRPHRISNLSDGVTTTIWVDSPPTF